MAHGEATSLQKAAARGAEDYLADPLFLAYFSALEAIAAYVSDVHVGPRRSRAPRIAATLRALLRELESPGAPLRLDPLIQRGDTRTGVSSRLSDLAAVRETNPEGFALLGVPADSSLEQLKVAYRQAARLHHPDRGGSHDTMVALNGAFSECVVALLPRASGGSVAATPGVPGDVEGLVVDEGHRPRGKWGALNAAQFEVLAWYVLIQILDDDYSFDDAYSCFQRIRGSKELEAGLQALSGLPLGTDTVVSGGLTDTLAQKTADWLRFAGRMEDASSLGAWGLKWWPDWNRTIPRFWNHIENRARLNIRGAPSTTWRIVITRLRRGDNARRLGLIDERRYREAKMRLGRLTEDRLARQAMLERFNMEWDFLERLPSEEDLLEASPEGEIPSPTHLSVQYSCLSPKQRGEYRLAFSRHGTAELLAKYQSVRETEFYRSLFEHYAATPKDRIRRECSLLTEVLGSKDANPGFAEVPRLLNFLDAMPGAKRAEHLRHMVRLEVAAPGAYLLAQQTPEQIVEIRRKIAEGPKAEDRIRAQRDGDALERFQKANGFRRLLMMDASEATDAATALGAYCRGLIQLGEELVYVENIQLGYWIDRLTGALVRLKEWNQSVDWLGIYFALPERYRLHSPSSVEERLRKRSERCRERLRRQQSISTSRSKESSAW